MGPARRLQWSPRPAGCGRPGPRLERVDRDRQPGKTLVEHCGVKFQGGETDGRYSALGRSGERHAARRVRWLQTVPITAVCERVEWHPVSLVRRQTTSSDRADHPGSNRHRVDVRLLGRRRARSIEGLRATSEVGPRSPHGSSASRPVSRIQREIGQPLGTVHHQEGLTHPTPPYTALRTSFVVPR